MHRERPQQRKARALDELAFLFAPLRDFAPRVRSAVEQVEAQRVADAPVVEVSNPLVHLRRSHQRRVVDERSQHSRFVPAGFPERQREFVIPPERAGYFLNVGHRHAQGFGGVDAVSFCHVFEDSLVRELLERGEHGFDLTLE